MADDKNPTMAKSPAEEITSAERTRSGICFRPNVDILDCRDELVVQADVPGASGEDVDINFEDGILTIHAKVKPRQPQETDYLLREYEVGDYFRSFHVSEAVDASKITAECAGGVLTLHLPKAEAAKPRKIQVKSC